MKKLTEKDAEKYIKYGKLSEPFLDTEVLKMKLEQISFKRKTEKLDGDLEQCLLAFLHESIETEKEDQEFCNKNRFSRSAKEIFESKKATDSFDFALVFATLARQEGIPTTILQTVQKEWTNKFINKFGDFEHHKGHTFCECFLNGKWVLVDPTNSHIDWKYKQNWKIYVEDWKIGDGRTFLPIFRGLDLGKKQTLKDYLDWENEIVTKKFSDIFYTEKVKAQFDKIKTPEELLNFMDKILNYGWLDKDKNEHLETMKEITKFDMMNLEEIFKFKLQSCVETAKFAQAWFDKNGFESKRLFRQVVAVENETGSKFYRSLHFCTLFKAPNGKWGRFEQSSIGEEHGVFYFDSFEDAFKNVYDAFLEAKEYQQKWAKENDQNVNFQTHFCDFGKIGEKMSFQEMLDMANSKENLETKQNKKKEVLKNKKGKNMQPPEKPGQRPF